MQRLSGQILANGTEIAVMVDAPAGSDNASLGQCELTDDGLIVRWATGGQPCLLPLQQGVVQAMRAQERVLVALFGPEGFLDEAQIYLRLPPEPSP